MKAGRVLGLDPARTAPTGDGTFSGYASLFGHVDLAKDVIEPGAFARSLRQRGPGGVRMLYQHDPNQPIGCWLALEEDRKGLFVRGRLAKGVSRAEEVQNLMRNGALDGLSIGFRTVKARKDSRQGVRRIQEADLWEISVVTFPMLPEARAALAWDEDRQGELPSVDQFEQWLTDAGLSGEEAQTVISKGFASLAARRGSEAAATQLARTIRRAARMMRERTDNR